MMILLLNCYVIPLTFNDYVNVELFFNVANPLTFNDDAKVLLFDNVDKPDIFIDDTIVTM